MSVTTVRAGLVDVLEAAGCFNVTAEETIAFDLATAVQNRLHMNRTHFWIVRAGRLPGIGGAGYIDRRHRFTIEGYIGLARDAPADGDVSDLTVSTLWDAVIAALEDPDNAHLAGVALDFEGVQPEPIRVQTIRTQQQRVAVHALRATAVYLEAN